jgi:hypothetical protein
MCMSCVSQSDALFWNGAAIGTVVLGAAGRLRDSLVGRSSQARRTAADRANRTFLASLGLDPDEVLGPTPAGVPAQ